MIIPKSSELKFYEGAARKVDRGETPGGSMGASNLPKEDKPYTSTGASKVKETAGGPTPTAAGRDSKGKYGTFVVS